MAKPFVNTTWANEIGRDGRPVLLPGHEPTADGTVTCPDWYGGTNFMSPSFDAARGLFFVTRARDVRAVHPAPAGADADVGDLTLGGTVAPVSRIQGVGSAARDRPVDR